MTVDWVGVVPDLDIYFSRSGYFLLLLLTFSLSRWLFGGFVSFVFSVVSFSLSFVIVVVVSEIESGSFFFVFFLFVERRAKERTGGVGDPFSLSLCVCVVQLWLLLCA